MNQVHQLTKDQALKFYDSKVWETWTDKQIVEFQLFQDKLCVPFSRFHKAMEKVLDRLVFTREFAFPDLLKREFLGKKSAPTVQEIMELISKDKRIFILDEEGLSELIR